MSTEYMKCDRCNSDSIKSPDWIPCPRFDCVAYTVKTKPKKKREKGTKPNK